MPLPDPPALPNVDHIPVEERLRRAYQELSFHVENTPLAVIEWDHEFRVVRWTGQAEPLFGWAAPEVLGKGPFDWRFVHDDDASAVRGLMTEMAGRHNPRNVLVNRNYTKTGGVVWCEWHNSLLTDDTGRIVSAMSLVRDISERKRAEREQEALDRQLLDAQKWECLGVLAGGVAHDFNNILTVILGNAGLAQRTLPENSPTLPYLEHIEEASRRAADLCRQMLTYAGRGPAATTQTDTNRLIRESAGLLEIPAARHARIGFDLTPGLPSITADASQVRQVLINLVMNAAEALATAPGEITIRTRTVLVRESAETVLEGYRITPAPGAYVQLEVSDTGPGMTDEVMGRMFDPFFTTKFPGRGLGLAAVLGIVRSHRGGIRAASAPGRGTTVQVLWPTAGPLPASLATRHGTGITPVRLPLPTPRGPDAALVVDDEMYVREVAASTLEDLGYLPVLAGDGAAGVELFRRHAATVRVAVIDVVMPGMSGDQVMAAIRQLAPHVPVVLISGYTEPPRDPGGTAYPDPRTEFLQKPFHPEDLAAAVRRVVGA